MSVDPPARPDEKAQFDQAVALVAAGDDGAALDVLDELATFGDDPEVRGDAALEAARICLGRGRLHEAEGFISTVRDDPRRQDVVSVLEAVAQLQRNEPEAAAASLDRVHGAIDARTALLADLARAEAFARTDRPRDAVDALVRIVQRDPSVADPWPALLDLEAAGEDIAPAFDALRPDDELQVIAWLVGGADPEHADRFANAMWDRSPGDPRVLAAIPRFAKYLDVARMTEWSVRVRNAALAQHCPLVGRGRDARFGASSRVIALAVAASVFGDEEARELLEHVAVEVPIDEVPAVVEALVVELPEAADSFVVGAATDVLRSLAVAAALVQLGFVDEARAVARHGFEHESAADVQADAINAVIPAEMRVILANRARECGDVDLADVLERLASA